MQSWFYRSFESRKLGYFGANLSEQWNSAQQLNINSELQELHNRIGSLNNIKDSRNKLHKIKNVIFRFKNLKYEYYFLKWLFNFRDQESSLVSSMHTFGQGSQQNLNLWSLIRRFTCIRYDAPIISESSKRIWRWRHRNIFKIVSYLRQISRRFLIIRIYQKWVKILKNILDYILL